MEQDKLISTRPWRGVGPAWAAGLFAVLAACTVGPDFTQPQAPSQTGYTQAGETPTAPDQHLAVGEKITADWWTLYRSQPLSALLEQAIAGNRNLAAAAATLVQAQEAVKQASGALYPQLDLGANAARQKTNPAQFGRTQLPPAFPGEFNLYRIGPNVSYAVDPFGLNRRTIEENAALADAQEDQLGAAYLTLTGNAVTEAFTIASLRAQIGTVEGIIRDDETNLHLVEGVVRAGAGTQLDIETATSQLASDRTLLPPLRQQLNAAQHALALLLGKAPVDFKAPDLDFAAITLPDELPVSLPSALVRQRPDVLAAEARLHAASAAIGVATAQLYPNITLSASFAQEAISPDLLFHGANDLWSFGAGLTAPLFHGGALEAQKRGTEAAFNAALATYEQTVLQSFAQVADVLDALGHDAELLTEEQRALDAAERSLDLTRRTYQLGNVGILQVLDAQRLAEQARLGYVRAQAQRYIDSAQLFTAMGGGWWDWRDRDRGTAQVSAAAR